MFLLLLLIVCFQANYDERFAFIAEWYDPNAALVRKYQLLYYPKDKTLEMVMVLIYSKLLFYLSMHF